MAPAIIFAGIAELLSDPSIVLHVYGKRHAVARRKMGHFTMLVDGPVDDAAIARAKAAHAKLHWTALATPQRSPKRDRVHPVRK